MVTLTTPLLFLVGLVAFLACAARSCTARAAAVAYARAPRRSTLGRLTVQILPIVFALTAPGVLAADGPSEAALRLEILQLKRTLARAIADADACRAELGPVRTNLNAIAVEAEVERVAKDIEAASPGRRVNRQTLALEDAPTPARKGPQP